jgi:cytidine deaminase
VTTAAKPNRPELAFGIIGPLGTDASLVEDQLRRSLANVGYSTETLRLSHLMRELPKDPWKSLKNQSRDEEIANHINAGNQLRERLGNDALALLGISGLREIRRRITGHTNRQMPGHAAIFRSLKRTEEIETLRRIYGPAFFVLAAHSPRDRRVKDLAKKIAEGHFDNQAKNYLAIAEQLVAVDEAEVGNQFGQDVRRAFPLADVIVDGSDVQSLHTQVERFVELVFGNPFRTPSRDEQGMFLARAASLRSASLARQVGAAICRSDGSVVAIGCNEVARSKGGQYWSGDNPDGRDFQLGYDSSDRMRETLIGDVLERLQKAKWLSEARAALPVDQLVREALREGNQPIMKDAQFAATIDYVRAVHAEMAAITEASAHGISTQACELFTTTFPCHDCAKHIVAAGIHRVVYIEPYPKSLVSELFEDSIVIDADHHENGKVRVEPFVGVAPVRYVEWFALGKRKRKDKDGKAIAWKASEAVPLLPDYMSSELVRLTAEEEAIRQFEKDLILKGLKDKAV